MPVYTLFKRQQRLNSMFYGLGLKLSTFALLVGLNTWSNAAQGQDKFISIIISHTSVPPPKFPKSSVGLASILHGLFKQNQL